MSLRPAAKNRILQSGFTLVEMAVVLVIIGILVGSFIGTISSRIDTTRLFETRDAMDDIRTVLYGYAMSQSPVRLPCPDFNNDGLEDFDVSGTDCFSYTQPGNLPWLTLGVARGDAWSSTYSYWVAKEYANKGGFDLAADAFGVARIEESLGGDKLSNNVAAVVYSHGKNQYGSIGVDNKPRSVVPANTPGIDYDHERENGDTDLVAPVLFISRPVTVETAAIVFDDIVIWISEYELKGKMVQAGALP